MRVLLTGASGFVGGALARHITSQTDWQLRVVLRNGAPESWAHYDHVMLEDLATSPLENATHGCDVVVHAAARVHVMRERASSPLAEYRRSNVDATLRLARQAARDGARRFIFLSSVKVHGEETKLGEPFRPDDPADPQDDYGRSKAEAEHGLRLLAKETGIELVIVRPPLVYGPHVRANFRSLMRAVANRLPLPLGAVDNRRSLVALDNLVDFVTLCVHHPAAANQAFLVSDGEDLSTAELIRRMARQMGRHALLIPMPVAMLRGAASVAGRPDLAQRICGNLQVDIEKAADLLQWKPPITVDEGLRRAIAGGLL